jgi:hypothetical protein
MCKTMGKGSYKLAVQNGQRAFYAQVSLQFEIVDNLQSQDWIIFDASVKPEWHLAAKFGVEYAWGHLRKYFPSSKFIKIKVYEIRDMEIDTSLICVAYSAALALFNAAEIESVLKPTFDPEQGVFLFPK